MRLLFLLILLPSICFAQQRPNILFIMSDDHDGDAISAYGKTLVSTPNIDRLAKEGMRFNNCFVGNSICSPARATLLTGQHSHINGVINNSTPFDTNRVTMPKLFREAGYQTSVIGKWHLHSYPSGFDYWRVLPGMGQYFDTRMITMNRDTITEKGYATDVITDDAINWLDARDKGKPFLFLLHHKAPHRYFFPPLKFLEKFRSKKIPEPATLYESSDNKGAGWKRQTMSILPDMMLSSDLKVDPEYLMDIPELKPEAAEIAYYKAIMARIPAEQRERYKAIYAERGEIIRKFRPRGKELLSYKFQWYMQDYLACIASIDENIGRVLDYLDKTGLAENTLVAYTSDQGFYLGENGWFDKRFMYDKSMRTPLLVRWPGKIKPGRTTDVLAQNIDFAPTLLNVAGIAVPDTMQGISLLPILDGSKKTLERKYLYYHYYEYVKDHTVIPHIGVRGERYKLIYFYTADEWEFYDLKSDPKELHNLINSAVHKQLIETHKTILTKLRKDYKDNGSIAPTANGLPAKD